MANATRGFYQLKYENPNWPDWNRFQEELDFILRQLWDEIDGITGSRGQVVHDGPINVGGNTVINMGDAVTQTSAVTLQQVTNLITTTVTGSSGINALDILAL